MWKYPISNIQQPISEQPISNLPRHHWEMCKYPISNIQQPISNWKLALEFGNIFTMATLNYLRVKRKQIPPNLQTSKHLLKTSNLIRLKSIADAANSLNASAFDAKFPANLHDMLVKRACAAAVVHSPHHIKEFGTRKHFVGMFVKHL